MKDDSPRTRPSPPRASRSSPWRHHAAGETNMTALCPLQQCFQPKGVLSWARYNKVALEQPLDRQGSV